jgi:hypothetical protein
MCVLSLVKVAKNLQRSLLGVVLSLVKGREGFANAFTQAMRLTRKFFVRHAAAGTGYMFRKF